MKSVILAILFTGCCASVETQIEQRELKVPIPAIAIHDTIQTVSPITDSTVQAILERYCKGETSKDTLGFYYLFQYSYERDKNHKLQETVKALLGRKPDTVKVGYLDTTKVSRPIIQEFGFWARVKLAIVSGVVGIVLCGIAIVAIKMGLIRLPI